MVIANYCDKAIHSLSVDIENDFRKAGVVCPGCENETPKIISLFRSGKNWIVSNFTTHYRKMHPSDEIQRENEKKKSQKRLSNPVTEMFSKKSKSLSSSQSNDEDDIIFGDDESSQNSQQSQGSQVLSLNQA